MSSLHQSDKNNAGNKSVRIFIRCSPELRRAIRMEAARLDKPVEDACVELIEFALRARIGLSEAASEPNSEQADSDIKHHPKAMPAA